MIEEVRATPMTAVIAEDETLVAEGIAAELDRHGIEVRALVRTEDEAVEAAIAHDP